MSLSLLLLLLLLLLLVDLQVLFDRSTCQKLEGPKEGRHTHRRPPLRQWHLLQRHRQRLHHPTLPSSLQHHQPKHLPSQGRRRLLEVVSSRSRSVGGLMGGRVGGIVAWIHQG